MNEFIVWDKTLNCFHFDERVKFKDGVLNPIGKDYTIHQYIGLKDINNKKIYENSSIIEFTYIDLKTKENIRLQGYFTWNDEDLRYEIDVLSHPLYICLNYRVNLVVLIEIVDTVQENKLGLIK